MRLISRYPFHSIERTCRKSTSRARCSVGRRLASDRRPVRRSGAGLHSRPHAGCVSYLSWGGGLRPIQPRVATQCCRGSCLVAWGESPSSRLVRRAMPRPHGAGRDLTVVDAAAAAAAEALGRATRRRPVAGAALLAVRPLRALLEVARRARQWPGGEKYVSVSQVFPESLAHTIIGAPGVHGLE